MTTAIEDLVAATGESYAVPRDGFARIVGELDGDPSTVAAGGGVRDSASDGVPTAARWGARLTGRGGAGLAVAAALVAAVALGAAPRTGGSHPGAERSGLKGPATAAPSLSGPATRSGGAAAPAGGVAGAPAGGAAGAPQAAVGASNGPALGAPSSGLAGGGAAVPSPPRALPPVATAKGVSATGVRDGALVVRTATLHIEVPRGQVPAALARVESVAEELHGYVATSSASLGDHDATATVTIRVPVAAEPAALARVEQVGKVRQESQSGQDVSGAHADLVARLKALTASRDRYLAILARARDTGDVLAIQQSIDGVQSQIEELQAEKADLEQRSAYSALDVALGEPTGHAAAGARGPWAQAWHDAWTGFTSGLQAMLRASGRALLLVLVALGLWWVGRTLRLSWRRRQLARLG